MSLDVDRLVLIGATGKANLLAATTGLSRERSIAEASKLVLEVRDAKKALVRSGMIDRRCWLDLDGLSYELDLAARPDPASMTLTFVDSIAAKLMRATGRITAKAGTTSRGAFLQRLARDAGVRSVIDPALFREANGEDLTRGSDSDPDESSWAASLTVVDAVNARRFTDGKTLIAGSDAWLLGRFKALQVRENKAGVGAVTWDLDDKGVSNAALEVRMDRWQLPAGYPVQLVNEGPATGLWLVESVQDPVTSVQGTATLVRKQALGDEPKDGEGDEGEDGRTPGTSGGDPGGRGSMGIERAVAAGKAKLGHVTYRYGATGPSQYDCSSWTQMLARAGGASIPRTAGAQLEFCKARHTTVDVATALRTRGALLFNIGGGRGASGNHVAMSLGGGSTLEARGRGDGVGIFNDASSRGWTSGALIPGI